MTTISIDTLSDRDLLERTARVVSAERKITAELLELIGEIDVRRLYLREGASSLFGYCTRVLKLSEHAAYHRIEAARAARRFPVILKMIADGSITLTTIALLRPHLTAANHAALLAAARHRSKREVEHQIACIAPKPDAKTLIRRLPDRRLQDLPVPRLSVPDLAESDLAVPGLAEPERTRPDRTLPKGTRRGGSLPGRTLPEATAPRSGAGARSPIAVRGDVVGAEVALSASKESGEGPRSKVTPLAVERYLLRVTLTAQGHARLRQAQDLLSAGAPFGDPAVIIERALELLVAQLERSKLAHVRRPRPRSTARHSPSASGSRHIPAAIRREVWARDGGQCAFIGSQGRCEETGRLEFHHVIPFARGGETSVQNLALRCRAHNRYEGEQVFGRRRSTTHRLGILSSNM